MSNAGWFATGHDPRRGRGGGKKGRSGRRPNWYKEWCESLLTRASTRKSVRRILRDPDHPAFATMWKALADRAFGKPGQSIEVEGRLTLADLVGASRQGEGAN